MLMMMRLINMIILTIVTVVTILIPVSIYMFLILGHNCSGSGNTYISNLSTIVRLSMLLLRVLLLLLLLLVYDPGTLGCMQGGKSLGEEVASAWLLSGSIGAAERQRGSVLSG